MIDWTGPRGQRIRLRGLRPASLRSFRPRTRTATGLLATLALVACFFITGTRAPARAPGDDKRACVYSQHSIAALAAFSRLVGRDIDCALVYNDAAPTWQVWDHPWFIAHAHPDTDWPAWKRETPTRTLIIAPSLVPLDVPNDWRQRGARGEYDIHFAALADNLVAAGLGDSVIRLAHEGNGKWFHDWFGGTGPDQASWRTFWARAARTMRAVSGAHFTFDWDIAAGFDTVPFAWYYPGDDVVDVIGFDYYDLDLMAGGTAAGDANRWRDQYTRRNGPADLIAFADRHHKPLSIPEWGLVPEHIAHRGGGDNPAFVHGIAAIVHSHRVAYSGYFDDSAAGTRLQLATAPNARAAYQQEFGKSP